MECGHNLKEVFDIKTVQLIINNYCIEHNLRADVCAYDVQNASDLLLGFLSDYWKLKVQIQLKDEDKVQCVSFFLKAISRSNEYKASIARSWKVFDKETYYYNFLKDFKKKTVRGLKPWNANLTATFQDDILVFEDLADSGYKTRNKLDRFDIDHTLQVLRSVASFHASSFIYEQIKSSQFCRPYRINEEYDEFADLGGYKMSDSWFIQCKSAALQTLKKYSKYGKMEIFKVIEKQWDKIWSSAIEINISTKDRNVLCHRDLWNNNIMFHYKAVSENEVHVDDCLLVDFQGVRYQPPASDVMELLYCNLEPKFREQKMNDFLNFYYNELRHFLSMNGEDINKILPFDVFLDSAEEQRKWGLVINACLLPQNCISDEKMAQYFGDPLVFSETLTKHKFMFIEDLIQKNQYEYKTKILEAFEEIVDRYIIGNDDLHKSIKNLNTL